MRKLLLLRIWILSAAFVTIVLLLVVRLYYLQVIHGKQYALEAQHQYVDTVSGIYDRGDIFMTRRDGGKIALATTRSKYVLAIDPRHVTDPDALYSALSAVVPVERDVFDRAVSKKDDPYEIVAKGLLKDDAQKVRALNLKTVILSRERERYYPGDTLAAHVVGFVAYDENNKRVGRYGIERYYNDILTRDSSDLYVNFFAELFGDIDDIVTEGGREGDVVLTIDPEMQVKLEEELAKTKEKWHSKMTAGIIMDPQTGEILAMGVSPTFDVNNFNLARGVSFSNPLVSGVYEMGSIIKVLTMAVGLDTGAVSEHTTYNDKGSVTLNGATIHNYDHRGRGVVPMQEILSQSLNTGVAFIARRVGHKKMREYFIDRLQLGEETGVDLPAEARGLVENLKSEREIEFATASFGQGVAFTPIATIRALAAVANGGWLVQPHIVKRIEYTTGLSKEFDYTDQRERVFKKETSEIIAKMLTKIVDEVLAHGERKMEHYSLGVKTGTAQLASHGTYRKDAYLHTYIGYGPSYDPRFIILLMNLEPRGAKYASQTLTDPFMNLAKYTINHLQIPPDR